MSPRELPAAPSVIDRLSRNAVDFVLDEDPVAARSLRSFYVIFDLVALVLLVLAAWDLVRRSTSTAARNRGQRRWLTWMDGWGGRLVVAA